MNLNLNIRNVLKQELRLSPQLIQTMKLLELTTLELKDELKEELEVNPFLEEEARTDNYDMMGKEIDRSEKNEPDVDYDYIDDYYNETDTNREEDNVIENTLRQGVTLEEKLKEQIDVIMENDEEKEISYYIISSLNEQGFLQFSVYDIYLDLKRKYDDITKDKIEVIRRKIMNLEPMGCASYNSKEALLIQMKALEGESERYNIINNYWDDVLHLRYENIAKNEELDEDEVKKLIFSIKEFEIYPGRQYQDMITPMVAVDAIVFLNNEDKIIVIVTDGDLNHYKLNHSLYEEINNKKFFSKSQVNRMRGKYENARFLLKGIYQRRESIYLITKAIFEIQKDFLKIGLKGIKPLKLKEIAEITGMHESTVSRITRNKYVQTPRGIYRLKYFFSHGIGDTEETSISTKIIKDHIREIIENETADHVYSDQEIVEILRSRYVTSIARRTVAKYRELLGIPKQSIRKRKLK